MNGSTSDSPGTSNPPRTFGDALGSRSRISAALRMRTSVARLAWAFFSAASSWRSCSSVTAIMMPPMGSSGILSRAARPGQSALASCNSFDSSEPGLAS